MAEKAKETNGPTLNSLTFHFLTFSFGASVVHCTKTPFTIERDEWSAVG